MANPEQHQAETLNKHEVQASRSPETMPDTEATERLGADIIGHALKAPPPLNHAETANSLQERKEEIPNSAAQLKIIMALGQKAYKEAPRDKREEAWNTYIECLNDFRRGIGNLPPLNKIGAAYALRYNDAVARGDAEAFMRTCRDEKAVAEKPNALWNKIKRIPGVNVAAGVVAGAVKFAGAMGGLFNTERKALGIGATKTEQNEALDTLAATSDSIFHLIGTVDGWKELGGSLIRGEEWKEVGKDPDKAGYAVGHNVFDIATVILTGGGSKLAAKMAEKTALTTAEQIARAGAKASLEVTEIAAKAGVAGGKELAESGIKKVIHKVAHAGSHAGEEAVKEVIKHTGHEEGEGAPQEIHARETTVSGEKQPEIHAGEPNVTKKRKTV